MEQEQDEVLTLLEGMSAANRQMEALGRKAISDGLTADMVEQMHSLNSEVQESLHIVRMHIKKLTAENDELDFGLFEAIMVRMEENTRELFQVIELMSQDVNINKDENHGGNT